MHLTIFDCVLLFILINTVKYVYNYDIILFIYNGNYVINKIEINNFKLNLKKSRFIILILSNLI